jgi:hypothetical protein
MSFKPRVFVQLSKDDVPNLGVQRAQVLCALAEAAIDEEFAAKIGGGAGHEEKGFRDFVRDVDDFLNYQPGATVTQLCFALKLIEVEALRHATLTKTGNGNFSRMSVPQRREVLEALKTGDRDLQKTAYTGFLRLVSSFYFGHLNVFIDLDYKGVSVDDQKVLCGHPWRPNDPRKVEPCNGHDPCD